MKNSFLVFALLAAWAFCAACFASELHWTVTQHTYEGLPLFTRYPVDLDYDRSKAVFPIRMTASLTLSKVTANGLPEAAYNASLESLDNFVVEYFENREEGQCVLVETFNGKRHFYIYIAEQADVDGFKKVLAARFAGSEIEVATFRDPNWSFIKRYAAEYLQDH
ncbi:DUF695 domain-containing protein [Dyella halodurans]|uniref:DUF695 domain-containing protein n=1 Tax=Dyella halodurans TaxID=1920171 RepID=A0ABV9BY35_9GAMM|nr:DUF695 domain-containing protein [Dyella halodurans]